MRLLIVRSTAVLILFKSYCFNSKIWSFNSALRGHSAVHISLQLSLCQQVSRVES